MDLERCSYLVQRGQDQEAVQKSSYLQRAVPPPLIYSCSVRGFEGYHKRCLLRVPTCNDSQRPQSHHHRCTCGRGFRGKGRLAGVGPSPLRHVGKGGYPPPTVRFSEQTSNPRTMRTVSCGALSFFWPQPPNLLPRAHQSGSDLPS